MQALRFAGIASKLLRRCGERLAERTQGAFAAFGTARGAEVAPEQDDPMAEIGAFLRRENGAELLFDLLRLLSGGKPESVADADVVRVSDDGAGASVNVAQEQIRCLPPDTGQL